MAEVEMMKDVDRRYRNASGLASRDHYSIFYGPLAKSKLLMIGANPGGTPSNYNIVDTFAGEHEYIEGRNSVRLRVMALASLKLSPATILSMFARSKC
jgi:hypothetical protein